MITNGLNAFDRNKSSAKAGILIGASLASRAGQWGAGRRTGASSGYECFSTVSTIWPAQFKFIFKHWGHSFINFNSFLILWSSQNWIS
jgi:hypothetical protein